MSANGRLWIVALGAAVVGALLGAGAVWATQQQAIATLNVRVIKADADKQAALQSRGSGDRTSGGKGVCGLCLERRDIDDTEYPRRPKRSRPPRRSGSSLTSSRSSIPEGRGDRRRLRQDAFRSRGGGGGHPRGDESPPPNDYYIVNDNKLRRKLPVKPGTRVTLTTNPDGTSDPTGHEVTFESWASEFAAPVPRTGLRASPYWITVKDGTVIKIEQQYLP